MKLLSLKTTNFKKLKSGEEIPLQEDLNVLVGTNNAGKTSLLQAIALTFGAPVSFYDPKDSLAYLVKDGVFESEVELMFSVRDWEIILAQVRHTVPDAAPDLQKLAEEPYKLKVSYNFVDRKYRQNSCSFSKANEEDFNYVNGSKEDLLVQNAFKELRAEKFIYNILGTPLYMGNERQLATEESFRPKEEIRQDTSNSNIREKLYVIKSDDPTRFKIIRQQLLDAFPELEDLDVALDEEKGKFSLNIKENLRKNGDYETVNYDIRNTGLGMQSLILIIANIYIQDSDVVLLDEPEVHMHPSLVKKFVRILQELSREKQIILTSHSIPLINAVSTKHILTLKYEKEEKGVVVQPVSEEKQTLDILSEIGFDVANEIFTYAPRSQKIIFVEGPGDEEYLTRFGQQFGLVGTVLPIFEELGGKMNAFAVARTIQRLKNAKAQKGLDFLVTLDHDEGDTQAVSAYLEEEEYVIWSKRQIENYLLSAEALSALVGGDKDEIKAQLEAVIDEQKEEKLYRFIRELFLGWSLNSTKDMMDFFKEHKGEAIDDYEADLELMIMTKFIRAKAKAKKGSKSLEEKFSDLWESDKWDLCDGRAALKAFRGRYGYNFKNGDIISHMPECPEEIKTFWEKAVV